MGSGHFITEYAAVMQSDNAIGVVRQSAVMRYQDERGFFFAIELQQEIEDMLTVRAVEIAGGFVGHENGRLGNEGAGQGDALLFSSGKLNRVVAGAIGETNAMEQFFGAAARIALITAQLGGQENVFLRGERGDQLVGLKDEADLAAADAREIIFAEIRDIGAV